MFFKNVRSLIALVALVALAYNLSGCGSNISSQAGSQATSTVTHNLPDSVHISINELNLEKNTVPQVTLRAIAQVHQFYQTTLALALMPQPMSCPADAGPHYNLTFLRGTQTLKQVVAMRDGCGVVTISGEPQERLASKAFWNQLDQAIYAATPIAQPQSLAIQHALQGNKPVQTARTTDAAGIQHLYSALVNLPQAVANSCNDTQYPVYQLIFQTRDQAIPAAISQHCGTISLNGDYKSRSGLYTMTAQFKQLFTQTLAGMTFASAHPDQLMRTDISDSTTGHSQVTDMHLAQQFYAKIFTLQQGPVGPDCPSTADKVNGTARRYRFDFTQWGLPVMSLTLYEGSCKLVQPSPGVNDGQTLLGDAAFWDMAHRVGQA